jgi:hypothetical protein
LISCILKSTGVALVCTIALFLFSFQIREHSDRFYVEQEGNQAHVKIQAGLDGQTLDRETNDQYSIQILAIDKGRHLDFAW